MFALIEQPRLGWSSPAVAIPLVEFIVAPLSLAGDREGARFASGRVTLPDGYAEAYRAFVESGWNVKHMVRLLVTSNTYRQSSRMTPELRHSDPQNRLFARQSSYRLPAELLRDNALAVSGLLVRGLGGSGAHPNQQPYLALNFCICLFGIYPSRN